MLSFITALVIPFVEINLFRTVVQDPYLLELPTITLGEALPNNQSVVVQEKVISPWFMLWAVGAVLTSCKFLYKGSKLVKLTRKAESIKVERSSMYVIKNSAVAFSCFNYIFVGEKLRGKALKQVIAHELVHIKEYHSLDLFLFEAFKIVMWFNPLIYIYQKNISLIHEYIADSKTAKSSKQSYCESLLNTAFSTSQFSFTNTFFNHSLIKKRILMLHKTSKPSFKLKYLVIIPLLIGMILYTSCSSDRDPSTSSNISSKIADLEAALDNGEALSDDEIQDLIMLKGKLNKLQDNQILPPPPPSPPKPTNTYSDIPYSAIDKVPTFSTCSGNTEELKACTSSTITNHVLSNFNKAILNDSDVSGIVRIYVAFKIDKNGRTTDIKSRAPVNSLAEEAKRVVASLPQMIPGEHRGKKVNVLYSLPIVFDTDN